MGMRSLRTDNRRFLRCRGSAISDELREFDADGSATDSLLHSYKGCGADPANG
jgi:hypothetical protein